jgi:hypothetical protein
MDTPRTRRAVIGLLAAFAYLAAPAGGAPAAGQLCADPAAMVLVIRGSTLCTQIDDPAQSIRPQLLRDWIERSARIVAEYYARFPAPSVLLRIRAAGGSNVRGGRTTNDSGLVIQVSVGRDVTADELAAELGRGHNWLAEGLAVYVEGIARAQFGNREVTDVWAEYRHSMPLGLPRAGEGGMDQSPSWGRTYWGGAMFCLQADVAIREQTGNRAGLQTALRAILDKTGGYRNDRDIDGVLRIGDEATGTRVLQDLYREARTTPLTPDLDQFWARLGVPNDPASQPFDVHAPLAAIRAAITSKP